MARRPSRDNQRQQPIAGRAGPIIGERILRAAPALAPAAGLVRSSHERWDGQGYPDALAADQIPIGARIIAVCDAYHAMTSDRPYRLARDPSDALAELARCAGSQFDPAVVGAFASVFAQTPAIRAKRPAAEVVASRSDSNGGAEPW